MSAEGAPLSPWFISQHSPCESFPPICGRETGGWFYTEFSSKDVKSDHPRAQSGSKKCKFLFPFNTQIYTFNPVVIEIRDQVHHRYNNWNTLFESETQEGHLHGVESNRKSLRMWRIRLCVKDTQWLRMQNTMNDMGSPVAETGQGQVKRSECDMFSPQFRNSFHGNWKLLAIFNSEDIY